MRARGTMVDDQVNGPEDDVFAEMLQTLPMTFRAEAMTLGVRVLAEDALEKVQPV